MNFDVGYMFSLIPKIIEYIPITLLMAVLAMVLTIVIGLVLSFMRNSKVKVLNYIAAVYISFFRAIPMLVQLFLIYYGLPQIFPVFTQMDAVTAAIISFGFKQAAFAAEIFRAAFLSVDKGQMEACLAGGMTKVQAYSRIIIPQAFRNALPATGNIFISLIKETSLAFTLGVVELFAEAKMQASNTFRYFEAYLAVALVYWGMVIIYSYLQSKLENLLEKPYRT
ncbi:ABC transporter permease [Ureibacillus massiliensis 4400831 = CIP 108448 = CCUG 49529]|uniref:ABC transporter permease n=1 Tax=Ureibacillus massiliensis 4400831 = CIP 108448 = CCUG 49529 TaxID=1211035 RepID=A0A0A3J3H1_9BACL|nr:amino acid ABC transporter permease [Ureibacillus massiliensis]KGR90235.1 ABC transporter permease [Ureibacillus massiliensis 4400831 = CIP 108448 = CCUG 49529]